MQFQCQKCHSGVVSGKAGEELECPKCKEKVTLPQEKYVPGSVIGDFVIIKEIARGGVGIVFLARQISLDRQVALKILQESFKNDPEFVDNFIHEARNAAKISHQNIVQAYAAGEEDGAFYFAMELIEGRTMKEELAEKKKIEPRRAAEIIRAIADALDCAWTEQKIVHQDLKPDNIMMTKRGQAKLADLGLARVATSSAVDDGDEVMGTPQYISPEQLYGQPTDVRSDIYSLGATFFHLVTGRFPYLGKDGDEIARKHVEEELTPPIKIVPTLPPDLNRIICKMMQKKIEDRYQSASDLVKELDKFLTGGDKSAGPTLNGPRLGQSMNSDGPKLMGGSPSMGGGPKLSAPGNSPAIQPAMKPSGNSPIQMPVKPAPAPAPAADPTQPPQHQPVKPPEGASGLSVKQDDHESSGPPVVQQLAAEMNKKKGVEFKIPKTAWMTPLAVVVICGLIAGVVYGVVASKFLPASALGHLNKVLKVVGLQATVEGGFVKAGEEQKAPAPAAPAPAVAKKPVQNLPPPPPPPPKTRPEYLEGTRALAQQWQKTKNETQFLEMFDAFVTRFPQPVTAEEAQALARLLPVYAALDEDRRVLPFRLDAHTKRLEEAKRSAEEIARQKEEERAQQAAAAATARETAEKLQEVVAEAKETVDARRDSMKDRVAATLKMAKQERGVLTAAFVDAMDDTSADQWEKAVEHAGDVETHFPLDPQPEESAAAKAFADFRTELRAEYADANKLALFLRNQEELRSLVLELPGSRQLFSPLKVEGTRLIGKLGEKDHEVSLSDPKVYTVFTNRLNRRLKIRNAALFLALDTKNFAILEEDGIKYGSPALKQMVPGMISGYLAEQLRNADEKTRAELQEKYGSLSFYQDAQQ